MAAVAKLGLVRVAIQTRIGKTHVKLLPTAVDKGPLRIPYNLVPPEIQQLHVFGLHVIRRHDTFPVVQLFGSLGPKLMVF